MEPNRHFAWLVDEIGSIKTKRFHLVDGPAPDELRRAIQASAVPFPPSYCDFVFLFGNAKLYRQRAGYAIGVLAAPRETLLSGNEVLYEFGHFDEWPAYFKLSLLSPGTESPVFEGPNLTRAAAGFLAWIETRSTQVRRRYGGRRWSQIVKGPPPFDSRELGIIQARRLIEWRVAGFDLSGVVRFEILNRSQMTLPYLTVGVRHRQGLFEGAVWLPISDVPQGQWTLVQKECYRSLASPADLEFFPMPDPNPEDREAYWEFRP